MIDKIFKKSLLDEIRANKKLAKLEKDLFAAVDPVLRVLPVHAELSTALQARLESGSDRIGDIIREKAGRFNVYANADVLAFHSKNLPAFFALINANPSLKEIFDELEEILYSVSVRKSTFYFALTLRRVSRFQARIAALLEKTPDGHADRVDLEAASAELKTIAGKYNDM